MKCPRHKNMELENGCCPECGQVTVVTESIHITNGPTLSAVTMSDGKNSTTTEWKEDKAPKVIKAIKSIVTPKKKGRK